MQRNIKIEILEKKNLKQRKDQLNSADIIQSDFIGKDHKST